MCISLHSTHLGMPGMHLCECWSTVGVSAVTAYGKTILFEIDTSGIDLTTLPLFLHGANRPQIWFEKKALGFYLDPQMLATSF